MLIRIKQTSEQYFGRDAHPDIESSVRAVPIDTVRATEYC